MNESANNIRTMLNGLGERTLSTDPLDLQEVVAILTVVEDLIDSIADEAATVLLETIAGGLRAVVLDEVADGAEAIEAIAAGVGTVERCFATDGGEPDGSALVGAADELQSALGRQPGATATEVIAEDVDALTLEDIAARLVACTSDDREALRDICKQLEALAAAEQTPEPATQPLRVAAAFIEQAILCSTDNPDKSLASAGDSLAEAVEAFESGDAPVEPAATTAEAEAAPEQPAEPKEPKEPQPAAEAAAPTTIASDVILPLDADMVILKDYIVEGRDHIEAAESALLSLETDPDDMELVNTVFRAFHTIKGVSGFFGLVKNQELAHLAENLLDRARSGKLKLTGGYADLCLRSCDALRTMIESVAQANPGEALALPAGLDELMETLADPEAHGVDEQDDAGDPMRVGDILVGTGVVEREVIETTAGAAGGKRIGEALVESGAASATDVAKAIRAQQKSSGAAPAADSTVRVATDRLDAMIDMVGELVIAQSMVSEDVLGAEAADPKLVRNVGHAGKIIRDLQDLTMSLRMVPLRGLFHKMQRLVRDLGRKSGKDVKLVTEGEDTEIDRGMVELLNDPLLHMIRNSVDHGIETAERRAETGKPLAGTVNLRAYHSAGNVVIELQDDGQGLNRERILAKALDRGLIDSDRDISDHEAYQLIWHPGFSTAETITDVSGRGVGMDVVKRSIEGLRGHVDVDSEPGMGATFILRLPLTMAIADAMLVRVGQQKYLAPTISIAHSFRPTGGEVTSVAGCGEMVMFRGDLLPMFRLHKLFGVPDAATEVTDGILMVIEGQGKRCAVLVDELLGQHQVVIKSLGQAFGSIPGVAGGAILGDGNVGLILDAGGLIDAATGARSIEPDGALSMAG